MAQSFKAFLEQFLNLIKYNISETTCEGTLIRFLGVEGLGYIDFVDFDRFKR